MWIGARGLHTLLRADSQGGRRTQKKTALLFQHREDSHPLPGAFPKTWSPTGPEEAGCGQLAPGLCFARAVLAPLCLTPWGPHTPSSRTACLHRCHYFSGEIKFSTIKLVTKQTLVKGRSKIWFSKPRTFIIQTPETLSDLGAQWGSSASGSRKLFFMYNLP